MPGISSYLTELLCAVMICFLYLFWTFDLMLSFKYLLTSRNKSNNKFILLCGFLVCKWLVFGHTLWRDNRGAFEDCFLDIKNRYKTYLVIVLNILTVGAILGYVVVLIWDCAMRLMWGAYSNSFCYDNESYHAFLQLGMDCYQSQ